MLKDSLRSIAVTWKCAKLPVIFKILQSILTAILTPMSIYFTQLLIDNIGRYTNGLVSLPLYYRDSYFAIAINFVFSRLGPF